MFAVAAVGVVIASRNTHRGGTAFAVNVGDQAPEFQLRATNGETVSLGRLRQRGKVLLFFYEGIMCQPCWDQLRAIQQDYAQFRDLGIDVVGITVDPFEHLVAKVGQDGIVLPVLVDEDARVSRLYDTLRIGSMHPGQRPGHTFILVGRDGVVLWRQDYSEMFVPDAILLRQLRAIRG
ncbi:MAG: peroxiredoxin family protein [bacterium]